MKIPDSSKIWACLSNLAKENIFKKNSPKLILSRIAS